MYRPVLVTPPAIKPVTLTEAKAWLDIGYTDKDTVITGLIGAATAHLDGWTGILGRCLCEQTWRQDFDDFRSCLRLPLFPVISITSVKYTDTAGAEQTIPSENYTLKNDDLGAYVEFTSSYSFPSLNTESAAVRVTYLAGYADIAGTPKTSSVPDDIKNAIALLVRHWFDNPGAVVVGVTAQQLPQGVDALLAKHRRPRF
jgi:uncharacterized phiE125 gp8 family phage protein